MHTLFFNPQRSQFLFMPVNIQPNNNSSSGKKKLLVARLNTQKRRKWKKYLSEAKRNNKKFRATYVLRYNFNNEKWKNEKRREERNELKKKTTTKFVYISFFKAHRYSNLLTHFCGTVVVVFVFFLSSRLYTVLYQRSFLN